MRTLSLFLVLCVFLAIVWEAQAKGRGGSSSGSRGGSWGRSSWGRSSSRSTSRSSSGGSKSSKTKKYLTRAAMIGGGAYVGYKLGKMKEKFKLKPKVPGFDFEFDDWNSWREAEGFLCRRDSDCTWVDSSMSCQDYELQFSPTNLWYGGDVTSIRGECSCQDGFFWDDDDLNCHQVYFLGSLAAAVIFFVVMSIIGCLICFCICKCLFS